MTEQSNSDQFAKLPGVTDRVRAARHSRTAWRELGEDVHSSVVKKMAKWLESQGFIRKNLDIDDLFARAWSGRMKTALAKVDFNDRWHFLDLFCLNIRRLALDLSAAECARRRRQKILPEFHLASHATPVTYDAAESARREQPVQGIEGREEDPCRIAEFAESMERLRRAIAGLPGELRRPFEGNLEGRTLADLATELRLSTSGVKKRLDKAHVLLRAELGVG